MPDQNRPQSGSFEHVTDYPFSQSELLRFAGSPIGSALSSGLINYFSATLENAHLLPKHGAALLVSNHAFAGIDSMVLFSLIIREIKRVPRFLGEHYLFRLPLAKHLLWAIGAIDGTQEHAVALLQKNELVAVYPGGIVDSFKLRSERYRLQWGMRAGFARLALKAQVPIVPIAGHGIDDMFSVVGREPFLGRRLGGSPRYDIPIFFGRWGLPIPRPVPFRFIVLPPIEAAGSPDDPDAVETLRARVHSTLDAELAASR